MFIVKWGYPIVVLLYLLFIAPRGLQCENNLLKFMSHHGKQSLYLP